MSSPPRFRRLGTPEPDVWNRMDDSAAEAWRLTLRNEVVSGRRVLLEGRAGDPIERCRPAGA